MAKLSQSRQASILAQEDPFHFKLPADNIVLTIAFAIVQLGTKSI